MSSSVGVIIPNLWKKVPNHHPVTVSRFRETCCPTLVTRSASGTSPSTSPHVDLVTCCDLHGKWVASGNLLQFAMVFRWPIEIDGLPIHSMVIFVEMIDFLHDFQVFWALFSASLGGCYAHQFGHRFFLPLPLSLSGIRKA